MAAAHMLGLLLCPAAAAVQVDSSKKIAWLPHQTMCFETIRLQYKHQLASCGARARTTCKPLETLVLFGEFSDNSLSCTSEPGSR
jgi:hypothetical protein